MKLKQLFIIFFLLSALSACTSSKKEQESNTSSPLPKKVYQMDKKKAAEQYQGTVLNKIMGGKSGTTYDFATSNVMWRASLKALDFIPLQSANYSGGVLITDWYSTSLNTQESIKIEIRFQSDVLAASSINVISYKKKCQQLNCSISKLPNTFNDEIKTKILNNARKLNLESQTKK